MNVVLTALIVLADDQTPVPNVDPDQVTPGAWGFAITFLVAVAAVLIIVDMTRRIRRVNYRAQAREKIAAEQAAEHTAADDTDESQP